MKIVTVGAELFHVGGRTDRQSLSNDTIDSVLRHQELGRAKELSAPTLI
jgi:hypothetical protein